MNTTATPRSALAAAAEEPDAREVVLRFDDVYERWFHEVCRWLRAMGAPLSELEDLAQEVFVVVERKLPAFDGDNPAGWLYRIAWNTASDQRRRAWFRRMLHGFRELPEDLADHEDPAQLLEHKQRRQLVHRALASLEIRRRTALHLYEIEGYSVEGIARLEGVPEGTVKTRLFHARRELRDALEKLERAEGRR